MSVGRPYFDSMVVPVGTALLFLIGVGPALPWGRTSKQQAIRSLLMPLASGALVAIIGFAAGARNPWTILTLLFGGYAAWVTIVELSRGGTKVLKRGRRRVGAYIVHAGAVIVFVAIAVSSTMRTQTEAQLARGQSATIGAYTITFLGAEIRPEPNRESTIARFSVTSNGKPVTTMEPRMNQYAAMREPIGTPDVHSTLTRDLYLSITNIDPSSQTVSVMMLITPMVSWIWLAVLLMGIGGIVTLVPYRSHVLSAAKDPLRQDEVVIAGGPSASLRSASGLETQ